MTELEKLREDLHLALTMRDQYFIQLGDAKREVERLRAALESVGGIICGEWCGSSYHTEQCRDVTEALNLTAVLPPPKSYPE